DARYETKIALDMKEFQEILKEDECLVGTIIRQHGDGMMKLPYLHLKTGKAGLEAMRAIKKALDPNNIMNPGKMLLLEEEAEVNELKQAEKERIQAAFKEKIDYDEFMTCTRRGFCWPSC